MLDVGDTGILEPAPAGVVSVEQEALLPENQEIVYGIVPPDGFAFNVVDEPESMAGDEGVIEPATSAGFTDTKIADTVTEAAGVPESVITAQ